MICYMQMSYMMGQHDSEWMKWATIRFLYQKPFVEFYSAQKAGTQIKYEITGPLLKATQYI